MIAVYLLLDPTREATAFYVGQSEKPAHRYGSHLRSRAFDRTPVAQRIQELKDAHVLPILEIVRWVASKREAMAIEDFYITRYPDLLNLRTNSGWRHTPEARAKLLAARRARIVA